MQFNFVVSTNEPAVRLWQQLGFMGVGTLPGAFRHVQRGFVRAHVMFRSLELAARHAAGNAGQASGLQSKGLGPERGHACPPFLSVSSAMVRGKSVSRFLLLRLLGLLAAIDFLPVQSPNSPLSP